MNRRVRVLYIIGTLEVGGTEGQLVQLVTHLSSERFEPVVCCLSTGGVYEDALRASGIPVKVIGFRGLRPRKHPHRVMAELFRLVRFVRLTRPEIVHGMLFWAYVLGAYAARSAGVPTVVASRRGLGHFKAEKRHYLMAERLATGMTDLLLANSLAVKEDVISREKVDPRKVRVIHNGIDCSLYAVPEDPDVRAELGVGREMKVVGVIANLIHYKGHQLFLQACVEIKQSVPGARFVLVGDGPLRHRLERLSRELRLESEVLFLGMRRDIPRLLGAMDVAVLPSLEEGFPNAVLEAMAAARPVVATAVGGVPEAVVDGRTGILAPAGDSHALAQAVIRLLSDPATAAEMGRSGRERVEREFGLDRMVQETESIYAELLAEREPREGRA